MTTSHAQPSIRPRARHWGVTAVVTIMLVTTSPATAQSRPAAEDDTGRVLLRLTQQAAGRSDAVLAELGVTASRPVGSTGIAIVEPPAGESARGFATRAAARPDTQWAELDQRWHPDGLGELTDDPYVNHLWGADNVGQTIRGVVGTPDVDVNVPEAWAITRGSPSVVVAVIDTGMQVDHPDLAANVWTNPGEIPGNNLDDDDNGYVDDVHGWDFANDDATVYDDPNADLHGTHVAGTIAAVAGNGKGIVGVAPDVTVMPLKFIGSSGYGYTSDAVEALEYAAANGVRITNNSWVGGSSSRALSDAIASLDLLVVAAAGNSDSDNDDHPAYPASYTHANVVSVAAVTNDGERSGFSNYGATSVDLGAPGSSILSTWTDGGYGYLSGTSMATPHVTAVAALVASASADLDPLALADVLLDTTRPLASLSGITVTGGMVDAGAALAAVAATEPGRVRDLVASPGDGAVDVSWSVPASDGGAQINGYEVVVVPDGRTRTTTNRRMVVDGLTNGVEHQISVRALNDIGGGPTASATAIPVVLPSAPRDLEVSTAFRQTTAAWQAPASDGGTAITGYRVTAMPADITMDVGPDVRTATLAGLPHDTSQTIDVQARTAEGLGTAASVSDVKAAQPAPTRLAGSDRYSTAVAITRAGFPDPVEVLYVATGTSFADALSGTAAAAAAGAPVLLLPPTGIPSTVAQEIVRLSPQRIWVLGGSQAVPDAVVDQLRALGDATVDRLAGRDRYATSAMISSRSFPPATDVAYLATGAAFADALGVGAAAAEQGAPVLLTAPDRLPASVAAELERLAPRRVVVLGGPGAITESVVDATRRVTSASVDRIGGTSRYETSAAVVRDAFSPGPPAVYVTTGSQFPDALAGGAIAATERAPVLLAPPTGQLPAATIAELQRLQPGRVIVLGGTSAIDDAIVAAIRAAIDDSP